MQEQIDQANHRFWRELCGTTLAQSIGVVSNDLASLDEFDKSYLDLYPYLLKFVDPKMVRGKNVLEIGLGYCTLGRILAREAKSYTGVDISDGPVFMANHSFRLLNLSSSARAIQGSALNLPLQNETFDLVVSIGCLHHTGDLQRALQEVCRVLKPGGQAVIMVYNRYSVRQWVRWPLLSLKRLVSEYVSGSGKTLRHGASDERAAYDASTSGEAAPCTEFTSRRELKEIFLSAGFKKIRIAKANTGSIAIRSTVVFPRRWLLPWVGPLAGLDLYATVKK